MGYYESKGIACWSGNDDQCFEGRHRNQSHGVISVIANLLPGLMRKLMDEDNSELNQRLQPLMAWLFHVPSPNALNTAMAMTGAAPPVFIHLKNFQNLKRSMKLQKNLVVSST